MAIMLRCLTLAVITTLTISCSANENARSFEIDYEHDTFLMDGKPFRYISGSVHYFRMPHQYWRDRLRKIKLLGLNAITTYIEWATHEPRKGEFTFEGDADFEKFIKMAAEEGLYVIARVGPYICSEREFGGFPAWLLTENPQMKLRTSDPAYLNFVDKWFQQLFKRIKPLLYANGGPIIMLQVENEYGAFPTNDKKYMVWLRDLIHSYVEDKAVLFTLDPTWSDSVKRGHVNGTFATVDFGPTDDPMSKMFKPLRQIQPHGPLVNQEYYPGVYSIWGRQRDSRDIPSVTKTMTNLIAANASFSLFMVYGGTNFGFTSADSPMAAMFKTLRAIQPHGPLVNQEFYPGRISIWGNKRNRRDIQSVTNTMTNLIAANASFSLFMVYGGTNFGFTSGAETNGNGDFVMCLTSNDYDSPITEAGDLNDKFVAIRNLIKQELNWSYGTDEEVEKLRNTPKGDYGSVSLSPKVPLLDSPIGSRNRTSHPQTMEYFGQLHGFIAYTHVVKDPPTRDPSILEVDIRDRALVLLDDEPVSVLAYTVINKTPLPSQLKAGSKLTLLVENEGRRKYGDFYDVTKGIVGKATLNGAQLEDWDTVSYELTSDYIRMIETLPSQNLGEVKYPMFFTGEFTLPPSHSSSELPLDAFLDMRGWGKGVLWVNGYNLGRYWHIGSQLTLYVPGVWLKGYPQVNNITVLELHYANANRTLKFTKEPIYEFPAP